MTNRMTMPSRSCLTAAITLICLLAFNQVAQAQYRRANRGPATLGVEKGTQAFETSLFKLELLNASQTVASLKANDNSTLDYTPGDRLTQRDRDRFYHLGDLNIGVRVEGSTDWTFASTAKARAEVEALPTTDTTVLAAANLAKTLPADLPLRVIRYWEKEGAHLILRFELTNTSDKPLEIGALGIPLVFNNNFNQKSLDQAHAENVFFDPYIGKDAGYLQVVRLNGEGMVLLVVPHGQSPFENYRPLQDDPTPIGYTFEGLHEWMIHTKAYAETAWKGVEQWNHPTSTLLKPGATKSYGLKFLLANSLREVENTLVANKRPATIGVPGYVLPTDVKGKLFINYPSTIKKLTVEPAGALQLKEGKPTPQGWKTLDVQGKTWGRARLTITYADGLSQTISYKVIDPEATVLAAYGNFLTTKQWFDVKDDPFNRAPSVITYDYEKQEQVIQDARAWICGLSDEGGAGSWLGAIMKQVVQPEKNEVAKLEDFVNQTIWGGIQYNEGPLKYAVRKSLFYYEPDSMPAGTYSTSVRWGQYGGFPSWNKKEAESPGRSYNYPHVAAAHWALYKLARNHQDYVSQRNWRWYLENAAHTAIAMLDKSPGYAMHGQMEGSVFVYILEDLRAEGMDDLANTLYLGMKVRFYHWASLDYPFGSEMPWDSTGQEEVYMWAKYFNSHYKANVTLNAILAYMHTVPHWGYNGNARRFWDFLYGGKLSRFERMIHHYGSALNAIPVLHAYRERPNDLYLLRVGYGGLMGALSNITRDGFAPCAFHSFPQTLANDGITGDYGSGFYGYAVNTSAYLYQHDDFGWLGFGGNTVEKGNVVTFELTTAGKNRVYLAPVGLWLTLDAGQFQSVAYNTQTGAVTLTLLPADAHTPEAFLKVSTPARGEAAKTYETSALTPSSRGSYRISLSQQPTQLTLNQR